MNELLKLVEAGSPRSVLIGLFGTSGFAREVMPLIRAIQANLQKNYPELKCRITFVDRFCEHSTINGYAVMADEEFYADGSDLKLFNVAVADSKIRSRISEQSEGNGVLPLRITAETSTIYDSNRIGSGAILCENTIITSNATVGKYFHCNLSSYVAHDCVIGDFVTFAPNVHCNGNVNIQDYAYIGTGAIIKQGLNNRPLTIGRGAIVGMGAVVTRDVPPGVTVVGNPARVLEK
jgi:sugar O-acyltransferase (sialic acid O-acetyltransferase NeuD family)